MKHNFNKIVTVWSDDLYEYASASSWCVLMGDVLMEISHDYCPMMLTDDILDILDTLWDGQCYSLRLFPDDDEDGIIEFYGNVERLDGGKLADVYTYNIGDRSLDCQKKVFFEDKDKELFVPVFMSPEEAWDW